MLQGDVFTPQMIVFPGAFSGTDGHDPNGKTEPCEVLFCDRSHEWKGGLPFIRSSGVIVLGLCRFCRAMHRFVCFSTAQTKLLC
jgi:hypothetical protein